MANVFFTGVTEINSALIKRFIDKGYTATVLTQTEQAAKTAKSAGAQTVIGELNRPETYIDALKNSEIVFHAPNIYDLEGAPSESVAIETIIKALDGTKKTFVYTSNTWVLGDTNTVLADEKTPLAPIALVAPLAQFEDKVLHAAKRDIRSIVVRTAGVYGYEGDFIQEYVATTIREKAAYFVGNGENYISVIALDDLLDLYVAVIEKGVAGTVYHAANGHALKTKELATIVGQAVGVTKTVGLNQTELKAKYGALSEAYALSQQIAFVHSKEQLKWAPKNTDLKSYVEKTEKALAAGVR